MRDRANAGPALPIGAITESPEARTPRPVALHQAAADDSVLARALRGIAPKAHAGRYIVVDLNARRLWYVDRDTVRFSADVGVGQGTPESGGAAGRATPRARFTVLRKDSMPVWVPPDWYFAELAASTGRALRHLARGDTLRARDGSRIYVDGTEVMRRPATGGMEVVTLTDTLGFRRELIVDDQIVVPPVGTTMRRYPGVLGPRRLLFRDGYGIHGTDQPETIGLAASHGCVRMRNEDVVALYAMIAVGTPAFLQ